MSRITLRTDPFEGYERDDKGNVILRISTINEHNTLICGPQCDKCKSNFKIECNECKNFVCSRCQHKSVDCKKADSTKLKQ